MSRSLAVRPPRHPGIQRPGAAVAKQWVATAWCFKLLCAWLLVTISGHALAAKGLVASSYLRDPGGSMTLAQAQAAQGWAPYGEVLSIGYLPYPVWLRLETPPHPADIALRIRIRPSYLDEVRLFVPQAGGTYQERVAGDRWPFRSREHSDTALAFDWTAGPAAGPPQIYLRILGVNSMTAYFEVLTVAESEDKRDLEQTFFGLFLGTMVAVLAWSVWQAGATRDPATALFSVYQLTSTMMNFGLLGYASRYLFPHSAGGDTFTNWMVLVNSMTGILFHRYFLGCLELPRWGLRLVDLSIAGCATTFVLLLAGQPQWALKVNSTVVAAFSGLMLLPLVFAVQQGGDRMRRQALLGCTLLMIIVMVSMLPLMGLVKAGQWSLYMTNLHGLMTAVVLTRLLALRRSQIGAQTKLDAKRLIASLAEAKQVRSERDEKERFLAMLTHELRTPLSVIRMVLGSGSADATADRHKQFAHRAVDDINSIIERCLQTDQLERGAMQQRSLPYELQALAQAVVADHPAGQRVALHTEPSLPIVKTDALLVRTVLSNLVDNALKYSPEPSVVTLSLQAQAREQVPGILVRLHNLPNRAGRPDPQQVFQKYYRSAGAHASSGSGLGLYLVAGVARMFGGEIVYRDDLPDVCFEFWLPTSDPPDAGPPDADLPDADLPGAGPPRL